MDERSRLNCVLVAGGKYHDIDFARLELLRVLADDPRVRVRVFEDYEAVEAIRAAHMLVSYTCDVTPSLGAQEALRDWVGRGGRWYALHGTNAILKWLPDHRLSTPPLAPLFMETLGTRFVAHPPMRPYLVSVADPHHPLTEGVEPFETTDELYLLDRCGDIHVLLDTEFEGQAKGFEEDQWPKARHPVFYVHKVGDGAVLYLTLGHCCGHFDMQPILEWRETVERGSWESPVFRTLVRRGVDWSKEGRPIA